MKEYIKTKGDVDIVIDYKNGIKNILNINNTILLTGRRALASSIANDIGEIYQFYISRMIFGDGGTQSGVKKFVDAGRTGLFGVTVLSKPVIANIAAGIPTEVILTSVVAFDEAVGVTLNEMALQMANGDLYSMTTFPDLNKTEEMQWTLNWHLNYI